MSKLEFLKNADPHITVSMFLYPTKLGGKTKDISVSWGCPCFLEKNTLRAGYDGYPLLGNTIMSPGETRDIGFWFMNTDEALREFRPTQKFYLWEAGFIGEAEFKVNLAGMTVNERLFELGLFEEFDIAKERNDEAKIREIYKQIGLEY